MGVEQEAEPAYAEMRELAERFVEEVRREAVENPLRTVAIAAGAGFVLGGGVFSSLTARTLGIGLRLALSVAALPAVIPLAAGGIWMLVGRQHHDSQG